MIEDDQKSSSTSNPLHAVDCEASAISVPSGEVVVVEPVAAKPVSKMTHNEIVAYTASKPVTELTKEEILAFINKTSGVGPPPKNSATAPQNNTTPKSTKSTFCKAISSKLNILTNMPRAIRKLKDLTAEEIHHTICKETVELVIVNNIRCRRLVHHTNKKLSQTDVQSIQWVCDGMFFLLSLSTSIAMDFGCADSSAAATLMTIASILGNIALVLSFLMQFANRQLTGRDISYIVATANVITVAYGLFFWMILKDEGSAGCFSGVILYLLWHSVIFVDGLRYCSLNNRIMGLQDVSFMYRTDRYLLSLMLKAVDNAVMKCRS